MAVGLLFAPDWSGRTALPQNHRRDPLPDHAFRIAVGEERVIGVVVNVDEARRHGQTGGVDRAPGLGRADFAHGRNFSVFNRDVSTKGRIAGPVHDGAPLNEKVKFLRGGKCECNPCSQQNVHCRHENTTRGIWGQSPKSPNLSAHGASSFSGISGISVTVPKFQ